MTDDFRAQITREDIKEALAALDRGESHGFDRPSFTTCWRAESHTHRRQYSGSPHAARWGAHCALMSFLEVRIPGPSAYCGISVSRS